MNIYEKRGLLQTSILEKNYEIQKWRFWFSSQCEYEVPLFKIQRHQITHCFNTT